MIRCGIVFTIVGSSANHLWRGIAGTSTGGFELLLGLVLVAESEIDDEDAFIGREQEILWLEVTVDDAQRMDVLDAIDYLLEELARLEFRDS
jgi:hypothetical protein